MTHAKSDIGMNDVTTLLMRVLELNQPVVVWFDTEGKAFSFRMRCYSARRRDRKAIATEENRPYSEVSSRFDRLTLTLVTDAERAKPYGVRVGIIDLGAFEITDPETGETLDLNQQPQGLTLDELGIGTSDDEE